VSDKKEESEGWVECGGVNCSGDKEGPEARKGKPGSDEEGEGGRGTGCLM